MSHVPSKSLFVAFVSFCWNRLYRKLSVFRCSAGNRQAAVTQRQRDLWGMGRARRHPRTRELSSYRPADPRAQESRSPAAILSITG